MNFTPLMKLPVHTPLLVTLLLSASFALHATDRKGIDLQLKEDSFLLRSDGVNYQGGAPALDVVIGKQKARITPSGIPSITRGAETTTLGTAETTTWTWIDQSGVTFSRTISRFKDQEHPGFTVRMAMTNGSKSPIQLEGFTLSSLLPGDLSVEGNPSDWMLSTFDSHDSAGGGFHPSKNLSETAKGNFLDYITLYADRGSKGLMAGAVGPVESDVRFRYDIQGGKCGLQVESEMNLVTVDPGEGRRSEEVIFLAGPYDRSATALFKWVAETHGSRTARGPVFGWCSWYSRYVNITEKESEDLLEKVVGERDRIPMQVIQLDDGWEKAYGDWTADPKKFPHGMKPFADKVTAAGMIPGIWLGMVRSSKNGAHPDGNPAEYLDPSFPGTREMIGRVLRERYAEGYRYFKLDFNHPRWRDRYDRKKTRLQLQRDMFRLYRESIGEDSYLDACVGGLDRAAVGYADGARIGTDIPLRWGKLDQGCVLPDGFHAVGSMAPVNGVLFAADPDVMYTNVDLKKDRLADPLATNSMTSWISYVGLLGGFVMTSDLLQIPPWNSEESLRRLEIMTPPSPEKGRAFDGGTDDWHRQFGFTASRPWGNFVSVAMLNPTEQPANVPLQGVDLSGLGKRFHVWSFWDGKYLGMGDESFMVKEVPPHGVALLRLSNPSKDGSPVLIGSDLHVGMGAAEIKEIQEKDDRLTIELTDAGAREGNLYFHALKPLTLESADGCVVSVESLGNQLWKVHVKGRLRGKSQKIRLCAGS